MKKVIVLFTIVSSMLACKNESKQSMTDSSLLTATDIMLKAMDVHGSHLLDNSTMTFNFRQADFMVNRKKGKFLYARLTQQDGDTITDHYSNEKTTRYLNGIPQVVTDSILANITSAVNSVVYFAQLPYSLDGNAVNFKLIGTDNVKGTNYYQLEVTFNENGGGEDHEDVFVYWIHQQDFTIDYLAYSYCEEECGFRFRESINRRVINGVIVQDYNNYRPKVQDTGLPQLDDLFEKNELELVSTIKTENVHLSVR